LMLTHWLLGWSTWLLHASTGSWWTIESSVIEKTIAESVPEPNDEDFSDEDEDDGDAYIDDGVVAPAVATDNVADDNFFCLSLHIAPSNKFSYGSQAYLNDVWILDRARSCCFFYKQHIFLFHAKRTAI
jgi:hypothetical protein